jgi:hypothetical protein
MRGINKRVTSSFVFTAAPCSFAVVLIPEEPIYSEVARVSLEIAKKYGSKNIIDNLRFPTHATIIISGTTPEHLSSIVDKISSLKISIDTQAKAVGVHCGSKVFAAIWKNRHRLPESWKGDPTIKENLLIAFEGTAFGFDSCDYMLAIFWDKAAQRWDYNFVQVHHEWAEMPDFPTVSAAIPVHRLKK